MDESGRFRNKSKFFVNAKAYIVDDLVAFIGSGNLTDGGIRSNYEAFVKLTAPEDVAKMVKEFENLFKHEDLWYIKEESIAALGYGIS